MRQGGWSSGLFDIGGDISNAVVSCFFPWITIAQNRAALQEREPSAADLCCSCLSNPFADVYSNRQQIRAMYDIPEDVHGDCISVICCLWCMASQHHREIETRQKNPRNRNSESSPLVS
mmetsp:Transcript_9221/g.18473  ORF Transcript_9221/g.18473 Transcript_9221/m.18473 type:complete len:119 (-) Transcript_9221:8-364(-)